MFLSWFLPFLSFFCHPSFLAAFHPFLIPFFLVFCYLHSFVTSFDLFSLPFIPPYCIPSILYSIPLYLIFFRLFPSVHWPSFIFALHPSVPFFPLPQAKKNILSHLKGTSNWMQCCFQHSLIYSTVTKSLYVTILSIVCTLTKNKHSCSCHCWKAESFPILFSCIS